MRLKRWTYLGPRLAVLALLAAAVHYGLPQLLRGSLTQSGQELVGTRVEMGGVECSWLGASLMVHDVAVGDPNDPWNNVLSADRVVLEIEPGSLLRKRLVVRRGKVQGLKLDMPRVAGGQAGGSQELPSGEFVDSSAARGKAWLDTYWFNLSTKLEQDLRHEFQSVALAEELAVRWPAVYHQEHEKVEALLARGRAAEARIRTARENPLRNLATLREATQEIEDLNRDLGKLVAGLHDLDPRFAAHRAAVWAAWEADRQKLADGVSLDPIDGRAISDYLLEEEVASRVGVIVRWIERVRTFVPSAADAPRPPDRRGANVLFAGLARKPGYLVRSLDLEGVGHGGGEPFELSGTIIGLTTQPSLYGRPTIARIVGRGSVQLDIEASLDRTGKVPIDRFVVHCPLLARADARLGQSETLAVVMDGGHDKMHAELILEGTDLSGEVALSMQAESLEVSSNRATHGTQLPEALTASLQSAGAIETTLQVEGTLDEPRLRMQSTIGDRVLVAVQAAATAEMAARRREVEESLKQQIEKTLSEVERLAADNTRQLEQRLSEQQTTLIRLAADTFGLGDRPTIRLGASQSEGEARDSRRSAFQR